MALPLYRRILRIARTCASQSVACKGDVTQMSAVYMYVREINQERAACTGEGGAVEQQWIRREAR